MTLASCIRLVLASGLAVVLSANVALAETRFAPQTLTGAGPDFKVKTIKVQGQPFSKAWQATTLKLPSSAWSFQLSATSPLALARGDQMLVDFYVRNGDPAAAAKPGTVALTEFILEEASEPWTKVFEYQVSAGAEWQRHTVAFKSNGDYAGGRTGIRFRAGYDPQCIEVGGVELVNYGSESLPADVTLTTGRYKGSEPDAPWRKAAAERIDQIRKGDITVAVTDAGGKPVKGAEVAMKMQRHAFGWGTAVDPELLLEDETYRTKILNLFNLAVIENHLKWPMLEWKGVQPALDGIAVLTEHGIPVRGHNLVWPGLGNLPDSAKSLMDQPDALRAAIAEHITTTALATKGGVVEWDVINEPIWNHDVQDILGRDVMVDWFRLARAADPGARLALNEAGALESPLRARATMAQNVDNIRFLLDKGAPLDVIGLQAHYGWGAPAPEEVIAGLDMYAQFGKPICISEFDLSVDDEKFKADYTRDFLTAAFSHPSVESVLFWGFWAGRHWIPEGAMYREDWSLRPLGQAYKDLVLKQWWTDVKGTSSSVGEYKTRGFLGDYQITVTSGKKTQTVKGSLGKAGLALKVVLK